VVSTVLYCENGKTLRGWVGMGVCFVGMGWGRLSNVQGWVRNAKQFAGGAGIWPIFTTVSLCRATGKHRPNSQQPNI